MSTAQLESLIATNKSVLVPTGHVIAGGSVHALAAFLALLAVEALGTRSVAEDASPAGGALATAG